MDEGRRKKLKRTKGKGKRRKKLRRRDLKFEFKNKSELFTAVMHKRDYEMVVFVYYTVVWEKEARKYEKGFICSFIYNNIILQVIGLKFPKMVHFLYLVIYL